MLAISLTGLLITNGYAYAQTPSVAPSRNSNDVIAALNQYKPDTKRISAIQLEANKEPPTSASSESLATFYLNRSRAAGDLGRVSQQLTDLRIALTHSTQSQRSRILQELGVAEIFGGSLKNALAAAQDDVSGTLANPGQKLGALTRIAYVYALLGDSAPAQSALSEAESILNSLRSGGPSNWARYKHLYVSTFERAKGYVDMLHGRLNESEKSFRIAVKEAELDLPLNRQRLAENRATPDQVLVEFTRDWTESGLATVLTLQGKLADAEWSARNVLLRQLNRSGKYSSGTALALVNLSRIVFERGRYADSATLALTAIEVYQKIGVPKESIFLAEAARQRGKALVWLNEWHEAVKTFDSVETALSRDPLLGHKVSMENVDWAYALIRTGQAEKAIKVLTTTAKHITSTIGESNWQTHEINVHLAMALADLNQQQAALNQFQKSLPHLIESLYDEISVEEGRIARTGKLVRAIDAYLDTLTQTSPSANTTIDSFWVADIARASHVQRAVISSVARTSLPSAELADLGRKEQDLHKRISTLNVLLTRVLAAPLEDKQTATIMGLRKEISALRESRKKILLEIEKQFPSYADLINPKPATVEKVQSSLRANEALVSIYTSLKKTYIWTIPEKGPAQLTIANVSERDISDLVFRLRKALDVGGGPITRFPRFESSVAYELYEMLLKPSEEVWKKASSLIIVPHRSLGQLPFGLLSTTPTKGGHDSQNYEHYRNVDWLIRRVSISQLPSASTLTAIRSLPITKEGGRRAFIGFGDPYFSKSQFAQVNTDKSNSTDGLVMRNVANKAAPPTTGDISPNTLSQLPRLPETADEIREIAEALKADLSKDVILGVNANEKTVRNTDLSEAKVIAFATHGLIPGDIEGLDQPALALTAPDVAGIDGDGLLTMDEIFGLKLNADWVILSACNTASSDSANSEALSGIGRAFFYAGAKAALLSNWPVETSSARLITSKIFKLSTENPLTSRAELLRKSMLWLMDQTVQSNKFTYAHPVFWAPFSLVGDGGN